MDRHRDDYTKWSKPGRERKISYDIFYMWNLKKNDTNELIYETDLQTIENKHGYKGEREWGV